VKPLCNCVRAGLQSLRNWYTIAVRWFCNRLAIALQYPLDLQSQCNCCATVLQWECNHIAIALQFRCNRFAILCDRSAKRSNRYTTGSQLIFDQSEVNSQSLCNPFVIILHPHCNRVTIHNSFLVATQSHLNRIVITRRSLCNR
jgi:hypothetical protein